MLETEINWVIVVVAAVVNMVIGALWYSPAVFGNKWMALMGKTKEQLQGGNNAQLYLWTFIGAIVSAFVMAHFVNYLGASTFSEGAQTGFWAWIGFTAPASMAEYLFSDRSNKLWWVNYGYHLVAFIVMGGILAVWG